MKPTTIVWPLENVFKRKLNEDHIRFILENSNIHQDVLKKIMRLCSDNAYHNYGHTLGVMRTVIEIAQAQGLDRRLTTVILVAAGCHDAPHPGVATPSDEVRSVLTMFDEISDRDLALCGLTSADRPMIAEILLATTFTKRGEIDSIHAHIIQDADIGYMGKGKYVYLFASIGLIDEFRRADSTDPDPVKFIRKQQQPFIDFVVSKNKKDHTFFLSEGAKKIMKDPAEILQDLLLWPDAIYWLAYDLRYADISLEEFTTLIDRQVALWSS
ncbi:MAG: HD domain-containing protein [candidate division SR1 bacterium]|nr:HD domain-containing protein [candidate division SR1 bacterium]